MDTSNFWRAGQAGVAVGRATSKEAIQITAYRKSVCHLRHPEVVRNFYSQRSLIMNQMLTCCNKSDAKSHNFLYPCNTDIGLIVNTDIEGNICEYLRNITLQKFPFDVKNYVSKLIEKLPKCTQIQIDQVQLLKDFGNENSFQEFLCTAYTVVSDLFNKYKVASRKNKCNWCKLCSHLHSIFTSENYKETIRKAFGMQKLKSNQNAICTRIFFDVLEIVAEKEASNVKRQQMDKYIENCKELSLDDLDKSTLRYIGGATIHAVRHKLEKMSMNSIMNNNYKAHIQNRKHQLTSKLIGSPQQIQSKSKDPESLLKLLENDKGGLLNVTDDTFEFFKLLLIQVKKMQNILSVQWNKENSFIMTMSTLTSDLKIVETWVNLFRTSEEPSTCSCIDSETSESKKELSAVCLLDFELDEVLILDILESVVHYFCKVHFSETVFKLKDFVLEKPKTFQLRHTVDESKQILKQVMFPCGVCQKECIDIINRKRASFDDFSVECDSCKLWYHYICVNLTGKEDALQENSKVPYFCPSCKAAPRFQSNSQEDVSQGEASEDAANDMQSAVKCVEVNLKTRGRPRGRGRGRGKSTAKSAAVNEEAKVESQHTSVSSRGRKRKAVRMDDYVT